MSRSRVKAPVAGVAWESPPTAHRPDWSALADELRQHPGEWMKVYEHGRTSWSNAVIQGHVAPVHPRLGFETTTTHNTRGNPRTNTLFMRYVPEKEDGLAATINGTKRKGR